MILNKIYVDNIIKTALLEDINYCDVTTDYLIPAEQNGKAEFVSKADGIVCGTEIAVRVFQILDENISFEILKKDGEEVKKGDLILTVKGKTAVLLKGERTALNLIQHMSGISTASNKYAKIVEGTNASIADTRKTLPGLRPLQKYAVMTGGAKNHRYNLSDAAMLKDNHIDAAGGITAAITKLRSKIGHMTKIEVETRNLDELQEALDYVDTSLPVGSTWTTASFNRFSEAKSAASSLLSDSNATVSELVEAKDELLDSFKELLSLHGILRENLREVLRSEHRDGIEFEFPVG